MKIPKEEEHRFCHWTNCVHCGLFRACIKYLKVNTFACRECFSKYGRFASNHERLEHYEKIERMSN